MKISHADKKHVIRDGLLKCARARPLKVMTYGELGAGIGIPARGPWKPILDQIADEEIQLGRPDITYLVVSKKTGYPSQIGRQLAKPPDEKQKMLARHEVQKIINKYNPGASNPFG
jgi:hypothetical protein